MTIHLIRGLEGTGKTTLCSALSDRGYAAIDTDAYLGLCQWIQLESGEAETKVPNYVDEKWLKSHRFIWSPQRMQELIELYEGRTAFICGSASNVQDFNEILGLRFYLWASDGTVTSRLQERDPVLWRYGSGELTRRLRNNRNDRTEAILNGYIVLNTELPVQEVASDLMAYVIASNSNDTRGCGQ